MQTLNVEDFAVVEATKNLASCVGGGVGRLDLNIKILNNTAKYEVVHNGRIKYTGMSAQDAAEAYNQVIVKIDEAKNGPK